MNYKLVEYLLYNYITIIRKLIVNIITKFYYELQLNYISHGLLKLISPPQYILIIIINYMRIILNLLGTCLNIKGPSGLAKIPSTRANGFKEK